ncbi:MAG: tetratricopeptide repeat protein [Bacteriovorax sp.]|jgi:tetratricopeptide (TPR) repeat protein|nr:tetratricopeptide repeat protein [Bacteriovorax sp.]
MKKLIPLLLVLSACASQSNYRKGASDDGVKIEEDYSWVDQLNFDKKSEAKYQSEKDEFSVGSEENSHALVKESLANLSPARLEETFGKADNILTKMNIKCYQGKIEEALKMADDVYGQYKNNTSYWNQLGTCYYLKDDYAKAILFYNKSRDLDNKFVPPVNNLGVVYIKQAKYQKALSAFKKASEMSTFSVTPNYNLAGLYLRFGTVGKAFPIFQGLAKKSPQDIEVNSALASANILKGDYASAISIYSALDKATLTRASVGLNYAVALKLSNRSEEALGVLGNVIPATSAEMKEYTQRVDKFIRN